jgi:heat shock protein HslJ
MTTPNPSQRVGHPSTIGNCGRGLQRPSTVRRSISTQLVALAAVGMLVAGCGGDDDTGSTSPGDPPPTTSSEPGTDPTTTAVDGSGAVPESLAGRTWLVTGIVTIGGPQPVPASVEATLTFHADGTLDVNPGCNSGSGSASFDGDTVSAAVAVTEMACTDRDRMDVQQAVLAVLGSPMHWNVADDSLLLTPTDVSDSGLQLREAAASPDTTTPPDTTGDASPTSDTTALLAAVAANRVFDDNGFGGTDDVFDAVGVVDALATVDDDQAAIADSLAPLQLR